MASVKKGAILNALDGSLGSCLLRRDDLDRQGTGYGLAIEALKMVNRVLLKNDLRMVPSTMRSEQ